MKFKKNADGVKITNAQSLGASHNKCSFIYTQTRERNPMVSTHVSAGSFSFSQANSGLCYPAQCACN